MFFICSMEQVASSDSPPPPNHLSSTKRLSCMSGSSEASDKTTEHFEKVFTEGPLQDLTSQCEVITAARLIGSSKFILESAMGSANIAASQPFGLPRVLHSHPTDRPDESKLEFGTLSKLMPLDRSSSHAIMPHRTDEL